MKRLLLFLFALCMITPLVSCVKVTETEPSDSGTESVPVTEETDDTGVPDDFEFHVVWGVYGISSYHSDTGKLTKTTDAIDGNTDKFVTTVKLDGGTLKHFYDIITALDMLSYPSEYDPGCGYSAPCAMLKLSYTANGKTYSVSTVDISIEYRKADNPKGQAFLDVINEIADYLTSTPEWNALPDYELFYD